MSSIIATVVCGFFILTLVLLERDRKSRVSSALWIPVVWLSISTSRSVSQWLGEVRSVESLDQYVEGSPLDAQVFAGLIAAGLVVLLARRRLDRSFLRANGPLLVFFLYCAVSVLWSDYPLVAFKRWTKAVGDLIMVLVVLTDPEATPAIKRLFARPGFVLIPLSILFIRYYPDLGWQYSAWTGEAESVGVATQKNGLGHLCLIFGLGSFWYLLEAFRSGERGRPAGPLIARGAILAMALWLFWMAHSATSFSGFLIGGCLMTVTSLRTVAQKPAVVHLLVGSLLFVVLYGLILNPGVGLTEVVGRDSTLTGRTEMWDKLLQVKVDPWFGAGYESFWLGPRAKEISTYYNHLHQAHNGYLEVFLDLGGAGMALLGLVFAWGYRNVVGALRWDPEAGRLKLAFFVIVVVYNLTEHGFREFHPMWIVFLLAIINIPKNRSSEDRGRPKGAGT